MIIVLCEEVSDHIATCDEILFYSFLCVFVVLSKMFVDELTKMIISNVATLFPCEELSARKHTARSRADLAVPFGELLICFVLLVADISLVLGIVDMDRVGVEIDVVGG